MSELEKVLIKLRQRQKLVDALFDVMVKREETISAYFPSYSNGDKKALLEEAENKIAEELESDLEEAYAKDLDKAIEGL
jgi:hypothetical protein